MLGLGGRGAMTPWPNEKGQNIIRIKFGFEFGS